MGRSGFESPANEGTLQDSTFGILKRMLAAAAQDVSLIGVRDGDAQEIYEDLQRKLVSGIGGNKRRGTRGSHN